jgi:hypothetical protein
MFEPILPMWPSKRASSVFSMGGRRAWRGKGASREHFADMAAKGKASPFGGTVERRAFGFGQPYRDAAASLPPLASSAQTISSIPLNFGDATGACPLAKRAV